MRLIRAFTFVLGISLGTLAPHALAQQGNEKPAAAKPAASASASPAPAPAPPATNGTATAPKPATPAPSASGNTGAKAAPAGSSAAPAQSPPPATASGAQSTTTQTSATTGVRTSEPIPGAAPAASGAPNPLDGSTYVVRLRDLELHVDELKEQIRRSHTRLSLLSDTILSGGAGGARAEIAFRNELSSAFRLIGAVLVLDGAVQYNRQDDSDASPLATQKEIPIFSGSIPPGDHTLQVLLKLRGHGYGVFSYLRGYQFEIKTSHSFTLTEGKTVELNVVAYEKGDLTTPLEQRPAVRFMQNLKTGVSGGGDNSVPESSTPKLNLSTGASVGAGNR